MEVPKWSAVTHSTSSQGHCASHVWSCHVAQHVHHLPERGEDLQLNSQQTSNNFIVFFPSWGKMKQPKAHHKAGRAMVPRSQGWRWGDPAVQDSVTTCHGWFSSDQPEQRCVRSCTCACRTGTETHSSEKSVLSLPAWEELSGFSFMGMQLGCQESTPGSRHSWEMQAPAPSPAWSGCQTPCLGGCHVYHTSTNGNPQPGEKSNFIA